MNNKYVIKYKGKTVRKFGTFRIKQSAVKIIKTKIVKWEQKDYKVAFNK